MCCIWPLFSKLGVYRPQVQCEECSRIKFGIDFTDPVLVYIRKEAPEKVAAKKAAKERKKPSKPKIKCGLCGKPHAYADCPLLVGQGSLLDEQAETSHSG